MNKILIIKHGSLGDIVLSFYPIFSIKKNYEKSIITILTEEKYAELFKCIPFINHIKIDNRPKFYFFQNYINLVKWFKKEKFDWVFDLQTSRRTNIYFLLFSLVCSFYWNGIAKRCSHPHTNKNRKILHTIDRQRDQLKVAGIKKSIIPNWELFNNKKNNYFIKKKYAIIVPGGSRHRLNKRWCIENFIEIIKYFTKLNIISVLIGGPDEEAISDNFKKKECNFLDLIGRTSLLDIVALSKNAKIIIGNDTGPMHLLVACSSNGAKKIILFGAGSDPNLCAPRGKNVYIVKKENINQIKPNHIKTLVNKNNYSNV